MLANATPCPEPPAGQEWACGPESLLGHATESAGLGSEPVTLTGEVLLTTGYDGAPFGLLVRTHAQAGPFDLGFVNVRSRINVDPHTAAATITTDPGPRGEAIPTILKGVPAQLKAVQIVVDRPQFEFNPTNCGPLTIAGTLNGDEGASAAVSSPLQVGNCQALPFKPTLRAATRGQASKANGASLVVKVTSGFGQSNIAKTDLQLPKALPSRLTTIQKACVAATFEANPASCPEGSVIGSAVVHTPQLKSPSRAPPTSSPTAARPSPTSSSSCRAKASPSSSTARPTSKRASPTRALNLSQTPPSKASKRSSRPAPTRR